MGMVLIFVGCGAAFIATHRRTSSGSTLDIGQYRLLLQGFDSKAKKLHLGAHDCRSMRENKP